MQNEQSIEDEFNLHYAELNRLQLKLERINEATLGEEPQTRGVCLSVRDALIARMRYEQSLCIKLAKEAKVRA